MSTGLGDAMNLAWKLASVLGQRANGDLLDTYEPERIAFARRLVATTDRVFKAASSDGPFAEWARTRTSYDPTAIWVASSAGRMQRTAWRSISCRTECAAAERAHDGSNTLATPSPFMRASPQMTAWRTAGLAR